MQYTTKLQRLQALERGWLDAHHEVECRMPIVAGWASEHKLWPPPKRGMGLTDKQFGAWERRLATAIISTKASVVPMSKRKINIEHHLDILDNLAESATTHTHRLSAKIIRSLLSELND